MTNGNKSVFVISLYSHRCIHFCLFAFVKFFLSVFIAGKKVKKLSKMDNPLSFFFIFLWKKPWWRLIFITCVQKIQWEELWKWKTNFKQTKQIYWDILMNLEDVLWINSQKFSLYAQCCWFIRSAVADFLFAQRNHKGKVDMDV